MLVYSFVVTYLIICKVWHGFISESELEPAYTSLALLVSLSLSDHFYTRILNQLPQLQATQSNAGKKSGIPNRNKNIPGREMMERDCHPVESSNGDTSICLPGDSSSNLSAYLAPLPKLRHFVMERDVNASVISAIGNSIRKFVFYGCC
jgi:hypothetical protein